MLPNATALSPQRKLADHMEAPLSRRVHPEPNAPPVVPGQHKAERKAELTGCIARLAVVYMGVSVGLHRKMVAQWCIRGHTGQEHLCLLNTSARFQEYA